VSALPRQRRLGALATVLAAITAMTLSIGSVAAVEPFTFGAPSATSSWGVGLTFKQPADLHERPKRVEILVEFPGAPGPQAIEVPAPTGDQATLSYSLPIAEGGLQPNTRLTARWRITAQDGTPTVGPRAAVTYADTRFDWKTRSGDVVRIHWYEGSEAFGRRALDIGERAVRETSKLLGVTETEPIDVFVYASQSAFGDVLGPASRENVGGQANAEIRTLFALIEPNEIDQPWVDVVVPHELTHLVFDTAVENPYHFPPRWLNEGLAVYLSEAYSGSYRGAVEDAARDGSLVPLGGLSGQFPTTRDRFLLAYGESVSAVDYFIRTYGRDALVSLIKSYARGLTDDEAFSEAVGIDATAFDEAWRKDLDAKEPVAYGPKPAPAGPLPEGWSASGPPVVPGGGAAGSAGPGSPSAPEPSPGSGPQAPLGVLAVLVVAVIAIAVMAASVRRRNRRGGGAR